MDPTDKRSNLVNTPNTPETNTAKSITQPVRLKTKAIIFEQGIFKPLIELYNKLNNVGRTKIIVTTDRGSELITLKTKKLIAVLGLKPGAKHDEIEQKIKDKTNASYGAEAAKLSLYSTAKKEFAGKWVGGPKEKVANFFKKAIQQGIYEEGRVFTSGEDQYILTHNKKDGLQAAVFNLKTSEELGNGAEGKVYKVWNALKNEFVALKIPLQKSKDSLENFKAECKKTQHITSSSDGKPLRGLPPPPHGVIYDDKLTGILMPTFQKTLAVDSEKPQSFDIKTSTLLANDIISGVINLHDKRGYCWRDPKPENMAFDGNHFFIFDFGASDPIDQLQVSGGTNGYIPPNSDIKKNFPNQELMISLRDNDAKMKNFIKLLKNAPKDPSAKLKQIEAEIKTKGLDDADVLKDRKLTNTLNNLRDQIKAQDLLNSLKLDQSVSPEDLKKAVINELAKREGEIAKSNQSRDVFGVGLALYEILCQKTHDEVWSSDQITLPLAQIWKDLEVNENIENNLKYAIFAMLNPDKNQRPTLKKVQDSLTQENLQREAEDLLHEQQQYDYACAYYAENQNEENWEELKKRHVHLLGDYPKEILYKK